jgi:hypothetical protein
MTAQKIRTGPVVFEADRSGDVRVTFGGLPHASVPHLDTIRLAYWLVKQYVKAAAKRSEGAR